MTTTVSITSQWQIYIPEDVRRAIGLTQPSQAKLEIKDNSLIITPQASPFLKLAGKYAHLKPVKPINLDHLRDYIDYSDL